MIGTILQVDPEILEDIAKFLGMAVGLLNEMGVLIILQIAVGTAAIVITGKWLFGFLGGGKS